MANPPFTIATSTPAGTDFASAFPATERTFRDIVESWLLFEHGPSGHHSFDVDTTTVRDADTSWEIGSLFYNTTTTTLQMCMSTGPIVWRDMSFPVGTRMLFQQTTAPTGWTKVADAAYEDAAMRVTTGTAATGGSAAFTSTFTARTILQANLPNVTLNATTSSDGAHTHTYNQPATSSGGDGGSSVTEFTTVGNTGSNGAHTHTVSVPLGGSGTPVDFAVKYVDVIVATKSA